MHLAILFEFSTLNGGERSLLAVMQELHRNEAGIRFTALAPPTGPLAEALAAQGIPQCAWSVREESGQRRPANEIEGALTNVLHRLQPELVHANSLSMGRLLGRIAGTLNVPTTGHLRDILGLSATAMADLNRNAALVAVSEATREFHVAQGLDPSKAVVIPNGVDLEKFQPRPPTGELHRELQLRPDCRLIVTIGQIGLRKGWEVLVEAVGDVAATLPDVHFLFVGARHSDKDESHRYEAGLKQRLIDLGWNSRVHWLGERTDVSRILNEVDLLVHPAHQEPLGRVLLEALASGVPIVATDVGGTREILTPDVSGRLVPNADPARLATAILDVLSCRTLSNQFRVAARQCAEENFGIRLSVTRHAAFWQSAARHS